VLEGHCADVGRDPAEITKTRLGVLVIAPTHDEAMRKLAPLKEHIPEERLKMMVAAGDPGEIAEQMQGFLDAGIEGLTFSIPDVHDLETVALAGETLAPLVGAPAA
jgi:alkanesulfonate monooxygenase SsuD/methylene tetrahydromethanopterin reductase-like flavin-dependent oxidoreductase (luciferase family)